MEFNVDITRLSSKGQIIIPNEIRKSLELHESELLLVFSDSDERAILLKPVGIEDFNEYKKRIQSFKNILKKTITKRTKLTQHSLDKWAKKR